VSVVEYCDNIHCGFNRARSCESSDIEFDENGICSTANYVENQNSDEHTGHNSNSTGEESNKINEHKPPSYDKTKDWLKYI